MYARRSKEEAHYAFWDRCYRASSDQGSRAIATETAVAPVLPNLVHTWASTATVTFGQWNHMKQWTNLIVILITAPSGSQTQLRCMTAPPISIHVMGTRMRYPIGAHRYRTLIHILPIELNLSISNGCRQSLLQHTAHVGLNSSCVKPCKSVTADPKSFFALCDLFQDCVFACSVANHCSWRTRWSKQPLCLHVVQQSRCRPQHRA